MSNADDAPPPDSLPDALVEGIDSLDRHGLQSVLTYVERRIDALQSPLEAEIESTAAGEVLEVESHGSYALVRKHPPDPDGSGVNTNLVSLYHVQREPTLDGTDSLHWTYIGDVRSTEQYRCKSCGGTVDGETAVCPHCGSEDIGTVDGEE